MLAYFKVIGVFMLSGYGYCLTFENYL